MLLIKLISIYFSRKVTYLLLTISRPPAMNSYFKNLFLKLNSEYRVSPYNFKKFHSSAWTLVLKFEKYQKIIFSLICIHHQIQLQFLYTILSIHSENKNYFSQIQQFSLPKGILIFLKKEKSKIFDQSNMKKLYYKIIEQYPQSYAAY